MSIGSTRPMAGTMWTGFWECSSCFGCCFYLLILLLGSYPLSSAAASKRGCSAVSSVMSTSKQSPVV